MSARICMFNRNALVISAGEVTGSPNIINERNTRAVIKINNANTHRSCTLLFSLLLAHLRKVSRFIIWNGLRRPHQNSQQIPFLMRETLKSHDPGEYLLYRYRPHENARKKSSCSFSKKVFVASLRYKPK